MRQILSGMIGALGFSVVFGIRKKYMWLIALNAGVSWMVYLFGSLLVGDFAGNVLSAACCSVTAAIMARIIRVPAVVLQMPATVPMIPGGSLYYTMYYIFSGEKTQAYVYFLATIRAIFAMAIGFAMVSVILKSVEKHKKTC